MTDTNQAIKQSNRGTIKPTIKENQASEVKDDSPNKSDRDVKYDDAAEIQRLHTHDEFKEAELRARIDELKKLPGRGVTALTFSVDQSVIYERIAELEAQLKGEKL